MATKRVALATLGCKVNQYESAAIAELFERRGYTRVDFEAEADVYVINSCTVTHQGDRKSRQLIRRAARTNPGALVVVTGCYAQTAPQEVLQVEGADLVVGSGNRAKLVDLVEGSVKGQKTAVVQDIFRQREFEDLPGEAKQGRVRAFLKIQEGCNNFCTYCIVPYARGPLRSRPPEKVLEAVRLLVQRGYHEIVLTGIHTGAYGRERGDLNLAGLMEKIAAVPGLARLRLSSVEPNEVTDELLSLLASGAPFCNHLHIPLQSGNDYILKKMKRRYDTGFYQNLISTVRARVPGVAVTTDVLVGFPGEKEEHFERTRNFIQKMRFANLHVFKYSPRRGTPAATFPEQVPPPVKDARSKALLDLGRHLAWEYGARYLGQTMQVLLEPAAPGVSGFTLEGLTDNYLRVFCQGDQDLVGQLVPVRITGFAETGLTGIIYN